VIEQDLFTEASTRAEILKNTLMKFVMIFNDVSDGIKKFFPGLRNELVPISSVMNEVKNTV
jgi:hypothetical protein